MVRMVGAAAAGLGHLVRFLLFAFPSLLLLAGCAAIVYGVNMMSTPGAFITAGGMALVAGLTVLAAQPDRRTK